ncbi:MAG TPA: hypothetical protein PK466_06230 [Thermotogota bacterium]|mgnify:CR=1 FL=1|nr:hypothetical protein [Thermotogota bacterium]HPR95908.1 hypothetical protein [Thermotogota bacterium]
MKRIIVLLAVVLAVSTMAMAQLGTDVYVGYNLGINTITKDGSDVTITKESSTTNTSFIDLGLLIDYEIADGFSIGGGIGGAIPISGNIGYVRTAGATATNMQYAIDGIVGVDYTYPLEPVLFKANLVGGVSFMDMSHMGYMVKAKFGIGYDIGGFAVSVGAGYELRNYSIASAVEGGTAGSVMFNSIPIELGITIRF